MADVDENAYAALGLAFEDAPSEATIKKAFRKLALKCHPDKRPASERERAEKEFDALRRASDALLDVDARRALDDFLRAKAARARAKAAHGAKRKRDLEDLEARERKAASAGEVGAERAARERLRGELERLRRRREEATRGGKARDGDGVGTAATTSTVPEHLYRALKVVWRRDGDADDDAYSAKELREIFETFGRIEDVVIREGKKKKGSALVVFADGDACATASGATCGRSSNPLVVARAAIPPKVDAGEPAKRRDDAASGGVSPAPASETTAARAPSVANLDFESVVLERLKRAQERARLVAEAEAEGDDES